MLVSRQLASLANAMEKHDAVGIIVVEGGVFANGVQRSLKELLVEAMRVDARLVDVFSDALGEVVTIQ